MTTKERFDAKWIVEPFSGCWLWIAGSCAGHCPYGKFHYQKRLHMAHRMARELYVGPIPEGSLVLHKCDVAPCVNPKHLFLGDYTDNSRDCLRKGRFGRSKLNHSQAAEIRASDGSCIQLGRAFGVKPHTIHRIKTGEFWKP